MEITQLNLKWLDAFRAIARQGSAQDAAVELGISTSSVSHRVSCLEKAVGISLVDREHRPMKLTSKGETFLKSVDEALWQLKKGIAEIWAEDLKSHIKSLKFAHIDDFDTEVGPAVVGSLCSMLPNCALSVLSRASGEILDLLQCEQIDMGVAALGHGDVQGLPAVSILRDPYVIVTSSRISANISTVQDMAELGRSLPFIRYRRSLFMGRRVETQLQRLRLSFPEKMELENTLSIMALVAENCGWTITSALSFARARRYHDSLKVHPFKTKSFSREIGLFHSKQVPNDLVIPLVRNLRNFIQKMVVEPTCIQHPWLSEEFRVLHSEEQ